MRSSSDMDIRGRRVLVTGGSSGIGLATARALSDAGARVALLARGEEALREAAESIEPRPAWVVADIADLDGLARAVGEASARLGGLDAVVANAGAGAAGPFVEMAAEDYTRTIEVTLLGTLHTARVALPELERTHGTLVIVGSVAGRTPTPWLAAYTAAKHGVRGFARTLSVELAAQRSPVKVALVAPGPIDTPFWKRTRTTDGRLPPELRGVYPAEDVAAEILRALASPRTERTVGGLMVLWTAVDSLAPNAVVRAMGPIARLGWRRRGERPSSAPDALGHESRDAEIEGDLRQRPSILRRLRDLARAGR